MTSDASLDKNKHWNDMTSPFSRIRVAPIVLSNIGVSAKVCGMNSIDFKEDYFKLISFFFLPNLLFETNL